ncbi:MAG: cbb3-type cytochrome c oxidase subunit I [Acidobacteriota bacterium]
MVRVPVNDRLNCPQVVVYFMLTSFVACGIAVVAGLLAAFSYTPYYGYLRAGGLTLQHLRPLHVTFAAAWIFCAATTIVYFYIHNHCVSPPVKSRRKPLWHLLFWWMAGIGVLTTLTAGSFSGREYLGFHPLFSFLFLVGWLLFAAIYFSCVGFSLRGQPVYIYMWSVGVILFVITFLEGHLYLIEAVSNRPLRDIAIQWKSYGSLVGSFNLLVYGSLAYLSERISGSSKYAHSNTAFALFYLGVLNTFTNYGHHTYHLPQSAWLHWLSFLVSMLEIVILLKLLLDIRGLFRHRHRQKSYPVTRLIVTCATLWTFVLLILAILISIPPVNTLIHGTHMVVAHSMGSMLGIDSMILWAGCSLILHSLLGDNHPVLAGKAVSSVIVLLNIFLLLFWSSFVAKGLFVGVTRYMGSSGPDFSLLESEFPLVMVVSGAATALSILVLLFLWTRAILRGAPGHRGWRELRAL